MRLTKEKVEQTRFPEAGQYFLRDSIDMGLALRVTPGAKTFVLERRINGKVVRGALGQFPDFTLAAARERAREYKGMIAKGINPFEEKRKARQAEREALTFGDLANLYVEEYAKHHRKSWPRDKKRLERHFEPVESTQARRHHARSHEQGATGDQEGYAGPVEANRAVQLLRSAFNKAAELKWYVGENPVLGGKGFFFEERSRERFLTPEEAARVGQALAEERDWRWPAYVTLDLLLRTAKDGIALGAMGVHRSDAANAHAAEDEGEAEPHPALAGCCL